jgi:hypothetical protein
MARYLGADVAKIIADEHEEQGDREGQPLNEEQMDRSNNRVGRSCAAGDKNKNCWDSCTDAYKQGNVSNCLENVAFPTMRHDLDPTELDLPSAISDVASARSEAMVTAAGVYSVERGLIMPLKSGAVRYSMKYGEFFEEASGYAALLTLNLATAHAYAAEYSDCQ